MSADIFRPDGTLVENVPAGKTIRAISVRVTATSLGGVEKKYDWNPGEILRITMTKDGYIVRLQSYNSESFPVKAIRGPESAEDLLVHHVRDITFPNNRLLEGHYSLVPVQDI